MALNISHLLRGCEPGRIQTVGIMQVIPLVSDFETDAIAPANELVVSNRGYGNLEFLNDGDDTVLLPTNSAYMVKERAQDHATSSALFLKGKNKTSYNSAMCVQETQGGYIPAGKHQFAILPMSLRERAVATRNESEYGRLWSDIQRLRNDVGEGGSGNLVEFMQKFQKELDEFVAEFEVVRRQVGAIILIGGKVVGIERAPSRAYWLTVWQPLIRECYGAEAIRQAKLGTAKAPRRKPLRSVRDINDLSVALSEVDTQEDAQVRSIIRDLLDEEFQQTKDGTNDDMVLLTVNNSQFSGQVVDEGGRIHYVSLTTTRGWSKSGEWRSSKEFRV